METSKNISEMVKEAVKMVNEHDWFWCFADYTHPALENARGHMAAFVSLINNIKNVEVREALRNLWIAKSEWATVNLTNINEESAKIYRAKEQATLTAINSIINPMSIAA